MKKKISFSIISIIFIIIFCPTRGFIFSVIIAIYNTRKYLDDSIGSLINQTIGFKKIQIILVNDGSNDNSENKCLKYQNKYPNNIIYIKIGHSGVSRARNIGMGYTTGKYINFLDADDKWESRALKFVILFFELYKKVNIVSGRIKFFEMLNSFHPLDYKFYKTRVTNLTEEYNCIQISGPSSFFRSSLIKGKKFDENIFSGEDTIFINNILLLNPKIGFIREAIYYYRKRSDSSSAVQTQSSKVEFYFSQIKNVGQYLLDKSRELYNISLPFIQYYIGYNVLFRILSPAFKFLNISDYTEYCNIIETQLKQIEDKYILEQIFTSYRTKLFALSKKYNKDIRYDVLYKKESLLYYNQILLNFKRTNNIMIWRSLEIRENIIHLEGKDNLYMPKENYFYYAKVGKEIFYPKYYDYSNYDFYTMYGLTDKGRMVVFDIPIKNTNPQILSFFISYINEESEIFPSLGSFTHITSSRNGYYSNGKYIIKLIEKRFNIFIYKKSLEQSFENQYYIDLKKLSKDNIIKIRTAYIKERETKKNEKKLIWLINDKKDKAGDNGEFFFRYLMRKNIKDTEIYFVIQKNCDDYERMKHFGNILDLFSYTYLIKFLNSDKIISSISDSWVTNPFLSEQKYIRDLLHFDIIFITNGIIKDDLSYYLNRINKNFSLIITSSKKEYNSIISFKYGYNKDNVILTGLPRYDNLKRLYKFIKKENIILIIPSWRTYIRGTRNLITHKSTYSNNFKNTTFYKFYNNLINSEKLVSFMEKFNYTGIFCLHPYYSKQIKDFVINKFFIIKANCKYQKYLIKSSLLVTDYSSLSFDFAFIKKPIIYFQFDIEQYRKLQYPKGFFDYKKNGFGPICENIECTIKEIIKQMINHCKMNKNYLRRIEKFFTFSDQNNNERLYYKIRKKSFQKINKDRIIFLLHIIFGLLYILYKIMIKK